MSNSQACDSPNDDVHGLQRQDKGCGCTAPYTKTPAQVQCTLLSHALLATTSVNIVTSVVGFPVAIFACAHPVAWMVSFLQDSLYIVLF